MATGPAVVEHAASDPADHPPIPIQVALEEPGHVTLAIEDASSRRVRNLVSETRFPADGRLVAPSSAAAAQENNR